MKCEAPSSLYSSMNSISHKGCSHWLWKGLMHTAKDKSLDKCFTGIGCTRSHLDSSFEGVGVVLKPKVTLCKKLEFQ